MQLVGDPQGITDLKEIKDGHKEYLKFLLNEAKTNFGGITEFRSIDGERKWRLTFDAQKQEIRIDLP